MNQTPHNSDRLLPCLLDRLTDDYPRAKKEGRSHRAIGIRQYKDSVLRDISWLLNSVAYPQGDGFTNYPHAVKSVLNYGIPSLSGIWVGYKSAREVQTAVRKALLNFEPRIIKETLQVKVLEDKVNEKEAAGSTMFLEISGDLWAEPFPEQLYIKTELDLETGLCNFDKP